MNQRIPEILDRYFTKSLNLFYFRTAFYLQIFIEQKVTPLNVLLAYIIPNVQHCKIIRFGKDVFTITTGIN